MKQFRLLITFFLLLCYSTYGQSPSFQTFINPVIPGDHPDPTLTKIGNYFYTSGSSFNPTPKIYRSTDLVHWEVIAQPVSATWTGYGDSPGGGIWGGHTVFYNNKYWHFFGRGGGSMYFVTADQPEGPWGNMVKMNVPQVMPAGLGVDNSIFIDEDTGKWYLLTKAGEQNNHIVELGLDGQPAGVVLDLTWLNPNSEGNPYGWAEGPVMWKYNGYYYYSFAQHLVGQQYVMRSDTLTDEESDWTIIGTNIFTGPPATYNRPNHISPAVQLDDGTSWVIAHSYHSSSNWYAHGRQGLLCQVVYNAEGFPVIQYPSGQAEQAPNLPSSGIPWMVPKSDMFNSTELKPDWSFLGYISQGTYSLEVREGWLYLEPIGGSNTVIQNDGEHNYSLITRVDFEPGKTTDEAGLWIFNGPETHFVKLFSSVNSEGKKIVSFGFGNIIYEAEDTLGVPVWLKLVRNEHMMSGFYSSDGYTWIQVGEEINAQSLDVEQTQFNDFTGSQQGLYVQGQLAYFDLYIYRDAYTNITAQNPANRFGVSTTSSYLTDIHSGDWAMYAGVEFGNDDYKKIPIFMELSASSNTTGGSVEVWLDSIDTGRKIAECRVDTTGSLTNYQIFTTDVDTVSGSHDVYLKFLGSGTDQLFRINWFRFLSENQAVGVLDEKQDIHEFSLKQNYPNPFNPATRIKYSVAKSSFVTLKVYNIVGQEVNTLFEGMHKPGNYEVIFDGKNLSSGVYLCQMKAEDFLDIQKLMLLK
ncbi:MAG: family 43 glycosylhydrolase [Ignavibacteriaceae bacterium]